MKSTTDECKGLHHCKICSERISKLWGEDICGDCKKGLEIFNNSASRLRIAMNYCKTPAGKDRW